MRSPGKRPKSPNAKEATACLCTSLPPLTVAIDPVLEGIALRNRINSTRFLQGNRLPLVYNSLMRMGNSHIVTIIIDRPRAKNIIDVDAARSFHDACIEIEQDRSLRCAVITGAGRRYFCGGAEASLGAINADWSKPALNVASLSIPVIAAINGHAFNAGLELALACDIRIASEEALFGFPGIEHGILPSDGGTQRLPRLIGRGRALGLLLTGDTVNAKQALEMGLVDEVVPSSQVLARAAGLAGEIASKAPIAVRYAREAINSGLDLPLDQGLRLEGDLYLLLQTTRDRAEGVMSFRQKRAPHFTGE